MKAILLLLAMTVTLCGCTTSPIAYDPSATGELKSIAILTPSIPDELEVEGADAVTDCYGMACVIGLPVYLTETAIREDIEAGRQSRLNTYFHEKGFLLEEVFVDDLTQELQERGFVVSKLSTPRPETEFLEVYPVDGSASAILDVVVEEIGYYADNGCIKCVSPDYPPARPFRGSLEWAYRPRITAKVALIRVGDSAVLMRQTVRYNPNYLPGLEGRAIEIVPDPAFEFEDFESLATSLEMAEATVIEGLENAINQVTAAIGDALD